MEHVMSKSENPTNEELDWYMNQYTDEDYKFFHSFFDLLPMSTMGSLGPHSVLAIREICQICNPKLILEIGFNVGYSSFMWLSLTDALVYSVDNSLRDHTLVASQVVKKKFGDRFQFLHMDSATVAPLLEGKDFDFAFVDGDHSAAGIVKDLGTVRSLGIKNIAMDDYWPMFSAVQEVLIESGYEMEKQWGNIVLCRSNC
jgi:predicted O-methyltransferase YrrM